MRKKIGRVPIGVGGPPGAKSGVAGGSFSGGVASSTGVFTGSTASALLFPASTPSTPTGSTRSPRTRERQTLKIRALPQAPVTYDRDDQQQVRRAIEQSYLEGTNLRSVVFVFNETGQQVDVPLPFPCEAIGWRARLNVPGGALFSVFYAPDELATLVAVGGQSPQLTGALGGDSYNLDWTITKFDAGGILSVLLATLTTAARATLTIDVLPK